MAIRVPFFVPPSSGRDGFRGGVRDRGGKPPSLLRDAQCDAYSQIAYVMFCCPLSQVVMAFEEEFAIEIPDAEADKIGSVDDAIKYIAGNPHAK